MIKITQKSLPWCDSGGDAGGGGEGIKSAVAGVHMSPGDQAGATFGNAGVGGLSLIHI